MVINIISGEIPKSFISLSHIKLATGLDGIYSLDSSVDE